MVYEICVLVLTIILGVIGLEVMLWLHSVRKLINETNQTVRAVNARLPEVLSDVQAVSSSVRKTAEQIGGTANEVAAGFEDLRKNPLELVTQVFLTFRRLSALWKEIRSRNQDEVFSDEKEYPEEEQFDQKKEFPGS